MRIIFLGDIVGRSGRDVVIKYLPEIKSRYQPDLIIVNGENAAHGFGISQKICQELFAAGVDVITSGNHIWDSKDIWTYIANERRLIRPINYPSKCPGYGFTIAETKTAKKVLVINVMGRVFMDPLDDPFAAVEKVLQHYHLGKNIDAAVLDIHAEASSEKKAMGYFCDGRVSLVVGTHTHVPTADAQILPQGTAYLTDAGFCGDHNSILGMDKAVPIARFTTKMPTDRMRPAEGEGSICGVLIDVDLNGKAQVMHLLRKGPNLQESWP